MALNMSEFCKIVFIIGYYYNKYTHTHTRKYNKINNILIVIYYWSAHLDNALRDQIV